MEKQTKILDPKLDVIFQALFGEQGSERITKAFLEKILDIKIQEIELNQNPILRRQKKDGKLGVLDVIAKINDNQNVDIEMQMSNQENIKDRILYYWSRLYIRSINKSDNYEKLEKSIVILITNENVSGLEELECHTEWKILEKKNKQVILTDKLEIHIIELEKLNTYMDSMNTNLIDWLTFLQNPESERVKNSMKSNKELKEAKEKLDKISEDAQMQQLAWWREKWFLDENTRKYREQKNAELAKKNEEDAKKNEEDAKKNEEDSKKNAEIKKELEEKEVSIQEKTKKLIRNLLLSGMTEEQIEKMTGFTKQEIEKLK